MDCRMKVQTLLKDDYEDVGLALRRKKKKNPEDEIRNPFLCE